MSDSEGKGGMWEGEEKIPMKKSEVEKWVDRRMVHAR